MCAIRPVCSFEISTKRISELHSLGIPVVDGYDRIDVNNGAIYEKGVYLLNMIAALMVMMNCDMTSDRPELCVKQQDAQIEIHHTLHQP